MTAKRKKVDPVLREAADEVAAVVRKWKERGVRFGIGVGYYVYVARDGTAEMVTVEGIDG
jgi:hypothetical protein